MLDRFTSPSSSATRVLRALVVALLAAVAGCDQKPQWHGVRTDAVDVRPAPNPDASPGNNGHGDAT